MHLRAAGTLLKEAAVQPRFGVCVAGWNSDAGYVGNRSPVTVQNTGLYVSLQERWTSRKP